MPIWSRVAAEGCGVMLRTPDKRGPASTPRTLHPLGSERRVQKWVLPTTHFRPGTAHPRTWPLPAAPVQFREGYGGGGWGSCDSSPLPPPSPLRPGEEMASRFSCGSLVSIATVRLFLRLHFLSRRHFSSHTTAPGLRLFGVRVQLGVQPPPSWPLREGHQRGRAGRAPVPWPLWPPIPT